jgi:hypothetical protein
MAEEVEDDELVPEYITETIHRCGIHAPADLSIESRVLIERMLEGNCILCESKAAEDACLILSSVGVVMFFCSQVCLQDFINMNYLMEKYDDMVGAARFRNQAGNH